MKILALAYDIVIVVRTLRDVVQCLTILVSVANKLELANEIHARCETSS